MISRYVLCSIYEVFGDHMGGNVHNYSVKRDLAISPWIVYLHGSVPGWLCMGMVKGSR